MYNIKIEKNDIMSCDETSSWPSPPSINVQCQKKNLNFYSSKILFQSLYIWFAKRNQKYAKACEN